MVALGPVSLINRSTMDWLLFIRHTLFIIDMGKIRAGVFCVPPFVCARLSPCISVPACLSTRLPVCLSLWDRDRPIDHLYIPPRLVCRSSCLSIRLFVRRFESNFEILVTNIFIYLCHRCAVWNRVKIACIDQNHLDKKITWKPNVLHNEIAISTEILLSCSWLV